MHGIGAVHRSNDFIVRILRKKEPCAFAEQRGRVGEDDFGFAHKALTLLSAIRLKSFSEERNYARTRLGATIPGQP